MSKVKCEIDNEDELVNKIKFYYEGREIVEDEIEGHLELLQALKVKYIYRHETNSSRVD
jgi:hypothetical protein